MDERKTNHLLDVNSVSERLKETLKQDFLNIIKPYLQQDFSRPQYQTPKLLYQTTVGTGKTFQMVDFIGTALEHGLRVLVRAPTTNLAEDIARNINKKYRNAAAVWYGRERNNPEDPSSKMCPRHDVVSAFISMNASPELACGTKNTGYCEYHPMANAQRACGYRKQDLRNMSVVVVAGDEMLTLAPRKNMKRGTNSKFSLRQESEPDLFGEKTITQFKKRVQLDGNGDFDLVILDETNPLGMVKGVSEPRIYMPNHAGENIVCSDQGDQDILHGFSVELYNLLQLSNGRYLETISFHPNTGIQNDDCTKMDILEEIESVASKYLRMPLPLAEHHKLSRSDINYIYNEEAKKRRYLNFVVEICNAMRASIKNGQKQSPALQIRWDDGVKKLNISTVNKVSSAFGGTPFVFFDATPRVRLLEEVYGPISVQFEANVKDAPKVKRFQLVDQTLTYSTLEDDRWAMRFIILGELFRQTHGETGLICPMKVEGTIRQNLKTEIKINHFGALRGDNSFEHLPCVIIASRQAQHYSTVEDIAAVLTSKNIERLPFEEGKFEWYPKETKFLLHRSGEAGWPVYNDHHPDPLVESVRAAITDDNLEQAIGRTRYVRRYTEPLHEYILTNVATTRLVDGVFTLSELKAVTGWVGALLHAGIWLGSGKGAAIIYHIFRGLFAQRRDCLYISIIGDPAFETPEQAAKWRKDQFKDNRTVFDLATHIDEAFTNQLAYIQLLHSLYPIADFKPIKAKIKGTRYFAQLYVRTETDETPVTALQRVLGSELAHIEIEGK
jgi:hypothetical protein